MRSSRRHHVGTPLSLFAFQDIILTTIGVVLLIMLILALQLAFTVTAAVLPDAQIEPAMAADTVEQRREIDAALELLTMLKRDPDSASERMQLTSLELAEKIYNTRHELIGRRNEGRDGNPALREEIAAIHEAIEDAATTAAELREKLKDTIADSQPVSELFDLMDARARLEAEVDGLIANDSLVYIRQEDPDHTPILIEFRPKQTIIHSTGTSTETPEIWIDYPDFELRCQATVQAIQQLTTDRSYPLLLVQPGAGEPATCVREKLHELRIAAGFDLLDSDQTTVPDSLQDGGLAP